MTSFKRAKHLLVSEAAETERVLVSLHQTRYSQASRHRPPGFSTTMVSNTRGISLTRHSLQAPGDNISASPETTLAPTHTTQPLQRGKHSPLEAQPPLPSPKPPQVPGDTSTTLTAGRARYTHGLSHSSVFISLFSRKPSLPCRISDWEQLQAESGVCQVQA